MDCFAGSIFLKRRSRIRTRYRNRIRAHKMAILAEPRNYSIFDSSINRNSGAPSFPRSLRKGWETTEAHLDRKDSGRKRAKLTRPGTREGGNLHWKAGSNSCT